MVQLDLKSLVVYGGRGTTDGEKVRPENPSHFGIFCQAFVGEVGTDQPDAFEFIVCTPSWLAENVIQRGKPIEQQHGFNQYGEEVSGLTLPRGYVVVREWRYADLKRGLEKLCAALAAPEWSVAAERLNRYLVWEREGEYDEAQDAAGS